MASDKRRGWQPAARPAPEAPQAPPQISNVDGFFNEEDGGAEPVQVQVDEEESEAERPRSIPRSTPPNAPTVFLDGGKRNKWIAAGVVLALVLEASAFGAWWSWIEYQEYLAARPPDLFDVDSPQEAVAGESIGSARTLDYGDLDDWSKDADKVEQRIIFAIRAKGVHTQDLVQWTQRDGEDPKDEVLAELWTWLYTAEERAEWPLGGDLEICGAEGNLVSWSKVDASDGLVRVTRTGTDGKSTSAIESVKGGAYWCSFMGEGGNAWSLEMRWYPGDVITTPVDHGEPVTTRKVEKREVVAGIKLVIDHQ